ncbi:hypothetical protein [Ferrimonas lipolytica]|uniref:SMODS and SLOG-associating 2TM effector domain-containing protein n=1 Tax=Ferrimonas lipolytica TaxID=2724191 RepID=A0A6H1UH37_9GAMM|nr:hypothetical protein [Ferrimonas lipolytica]QIZ77633.1 hypothetical protein HER31_12460 [Ferrimonas lipolytica]
MTKDTTVFTNTEKTYLLEQVHRARVHKTAYFMLAKEFHIKSERWWILSNLLAIALGLGMLLLLIGTFGEELTIGTIGMIEIVVFLIAIATVAVDKTQCLDGCQHKAGHYQHLGKVYKSIEHQYGAVLSSGTDIHAKSTAISAIMASVSEHLDPLDEHTYQRALALVDAE